MAIQVRGGPSPVDVAQFIDAQPVGGFQIRLLLTCAAVLFLDGFDTQAIGYVAPALAKDLGLGRGVLGPVFSAGLFGLMIGALIFGYFLTVTQVPQKVTEFLTGLGLGSYGVLALIMVMYLVLGCLMDAMAMIILTVPIIFPVVSHLGFDPIWFGVIIVMTVELGLIHPPVGMVVFVIKSVIQELNFSTIFAGVLPFIVTDLIRLVILIAFPIIALWLPSRM